MDESDSHGSPVPMVAAAFELHCAVAVDCHIWTAPSVAAVAERAVGGLMALAGFHSHWRRVDEEIESHGDCHGTSHQRRVVDERDSHGSSVPMVAAVAEQA